MTLHEPTLYDLEAEAFEEAGQANGAADTATQDTNAEPEPEPPVSEPEPTLYLETTDETELRAFISSTSDVEEELLDVPEWKQLDPDGRPRIVRVLLRALSARERTQFIQNMTGRGPGAKVDITKGYVDLVLMGTRHPTTKKLLFKPADRDMLLSKNGKAVERIALRMSRLSGLDQASIDAMRKN